MKSGFVSLIGRRVPSIATDPPYGRSATTMKDGPRGAVEQSVEGLADALEPGGRLAICLPDPTWRRRPARSASAPFALT